jgi:hypothetical protein
LAMADFPVLNARRHPLARAGEDGGWSSIPVERII